MDTVFLETGTSLEVKVHPVVLFAILDHFVRRHDGQSRVIGTLLGSVHAGVVEVRNCFPVPHVEKTGETAVGKDFNRNMLALHRRINPKESIVGWYATTSDSQPISEFSCLIHDFYAMECQRPLQLSVDTSLLQPKLNIRAFITTPMTVADKVVVKFQQVRAAVTCSEAERVGINMMVHGDGDRKTDAYGGAGKGTTSLVSDIAGLESAIAKLQTMLTTVSTYVDGVVAGEVEPDISLGRRIADTLASVPSVDPRVFDKMFNDSLQDLLMIVYLSQLTRTQLAIAEKLTTAS